MRIYFLLFFLNVFFIQAQAQAPSDSLKRNEIYTDDQTPPKFPGGDAAFATFIQNNLIYPADAKKQGIQGIVFVSFTVNTNGSLSDIKVVPGKGISPSCDQAAIDVISKSPKWQPGTTNGVSQTIRKVARVKFSF